MARKAERTVLPTPDATAFNDTIGRVRFILSEQERVCAEMIERLLPKGVSASLLSYDTDIVTEHVLIAIARGVGNAIRAWLHRADVCNVFVWPGYERISGDAGRVVLWRQAPEHLRGVLGADDRIAHGIGKHFNGALSLQNVTYSELEKQGRDFFYDDLNVEWFNVLLREGAGLHSDALGLTAIGREPPSTHAWFALSPRDKMPRGLSVRLSSLEEGAARRDLYRYARQLEVSIPSEVGEGSMWADAIARQIRKTMKDAGRNPPNWPAGRADLIAGGARSKNTELHAERLLLYDLWLAACFKPQATLEEDFIAGRWSAAKRHAGSLTPVQSDRWDAMRDYLQSVRATLAGHSLPPAPGYTAWYSVPIFAPMQHRVRKGRVDSALVKSHLGTAMILCNHAVDTVCLETISAWVQSMYMELRSLELATLESESATEQLTDSFGHEVSKLSDGLFKRSTAKLSDVVAWETAPISISASHAGAEAEGIGDWSVVLAPAPYDALKDLLHTWGSVPFSQWGLDAEELSLSHLVDVLGARAANVAAARLWVDHAENPLTPAGVEHGRRTFQWAKSDMATSFVVSKDRKFCDIYFRRPLKSDGRPQDDRLSFLARLFMALMSNAAYHAAAGSTVRFEVERPQNDRIKLRMVNLRHEGRARDQGGAERRDFRIKTDGVVISCLQALGGSLDKFPKGEKGSREVETAFTLPLRHPIDCNPGDPLWIEVREVGDA